MLLASTRRKRSVVENPSARCNPLLPLILTEVFQRECQNACKQRGNVAFGGEGW
jgi:hypothetical protein